MLLTTNFKMNKIKESLFKIYCYVCTVIVLVWFLTVIFYLINKGFPNINTKLFIGNLSFWDVLKGKLIVFDGIWNALIGTFMIIILSIILAIPIGISAGIYLSEFCPEKLKKVFSFLIDLLAGIPSIIIGLFGFSIVLLVHQFIDINLKTCILVSMICLSILVLPYLIKSTFVSLMSIPKDIRIIGISLGFNAIQNLKYVLIPYSFSNLLSGIILSIGRIAEDTAVIMLTGAVAFGGIPNSIFDKFEALPFYIFYMASEHKSIEELNNTYSAALILLIITSFLFGLSFIIKQRIGKKW